MFNNFFGRYRRGYGDIKTQWGFNANKHNPLEATGQQKNTGTFTFAGTNRTYIDADGVMQTASDNEPVYEWVGGRRALRLEPAGVNLLLDSRNIDDSSSYWSEAGGTGTAVQDATGVDGGANKATTVTDSDASDYYIIQQDVNKYTADANAFCYSIFIKSVASSSAYPSFGINFTGGTAKTAYVTIDTVGKAVDEHGTNSAGNIDSGVIDLGGDFFRVWLTATDNGSNNNVRVRLCGGCSTTPTGALSKPVTGSQVYDCAQLEYNKKFPSSYIDNDGVTLGSDTVVDGDMSDSTLGSELITTQVNRDFSGASNWTNNDINAYDETGDLTITANAADQYCTLDSGDDLSMTAGKRYKLEFDVANLANQWTIKDSAANFTISSTVTDASTNTFYFTCTTTGGGIRITSTANGSSGDFDNFTCKEVTADDWNEDDYATHTGSAETLTVTGDQGGAVTVQQAYMDWSKPCWEDEVDGAGRLAVTDGNTITITDLDRDEDCYKFRDMGAADYFDTQSDMYFYVDINFSALTNSASLFPLAVTSANDDIFDIQGASGDMFGIYLAGSLPKFYCYEIHGGTPVASAVVNLSLSTDYYCTLFVDASEGTYGTLFLYIYSDAARTTLVGSTSLALNKDHAHDHIGVSSYNTAAGTRGATGTIENLSIYEKPTANYVYQIATTATRTAGSYTVEYGSSDGTSHNATGTYYDYITATDNDVLKIKFDSDFAGTVDDVTIKKMGQARLTEAGALTWTLPTGIFDDEGTVIAWWRPGFAEANVSSDTGIISVNTGSLESIIYHDASANGIAASDGANGAADALAFSINTWYKLSTVFPSDTDKFKIGNDTGSGMSFGTEATFDGAFTTTGSKITPGLTLQGPIYISDVLIYDRVLTTEQIDSIGGSP